ncbi:serine protease filzig-like [Contarinia nasturtii]|uniref:serine protease filzig-like n=1 Tax=Contarinia nasturtii TaxID=265458 RepID=UPI0012D45DAE|nr:serine protease filzig-like [Contarinia nasturtii]
MGNFLTLIIKDRHYAFKFKTALELVTIHSVEEVDVNRWTLISLGYQNGKGFLKVGNSQKIIRKTDNNTMHLGWYLYIGGYDSRFNLSTKVGANSGFDGCISNLEILSEKIDMINSIKDSANVQNCEYDGPEVSLVTRPRCAPGLIGIYPNCYQPTPPTTTEFSSTATNPNIRCNEHEWRCDNGNCINAEFLCDGHFPDCIDSSDEDPKNCRAKNQIKAISNVDALHSIDVKPLDDLYSIVQGSNFSLDCEASGYPYPKITWRKTNEGSLGSNVQQIGNSLMISNAQPENHGTYQCIATSNKKTADRSTVIHIEPRTITDRNILKLECSVEVSPSMTVQSKRQNRNGGGKNVIVPDAVVEINKDDRSDEGKKYICYARNEAAPSEKFTDAAVQTKYRAYACKKFPEIKTKLEPRIIDGNIVAQGSFPWMAGIYYSDTLNLNFGCGGTIISDRYILTAAHCVTDRRPPVIVRLGKVNLTDTISDAVQAVHYNIKSFTRHPNYNSSTKKNDIGLIRLSTEISFTDDIRPACLYTDRADLDTNRKVIVIGWGNTDPARTSLSNELRKIEINTKPLNECSNIYLNHTTFKDDPAFRDGLSPGQYCAFDAEENKNRSKDSCQGDSGGSLQKMSNNDPNTVEIVAIVSFGHGCALELPSIYTSVAHYIDWITPIVWPQN